MQKKDMNTKIGKRSEAGNRNGNQLELNTCMLVPAPILERQTSRGRQVQKTCRLCNISTEEQTRTNRARHVGNIC